MNNLKCNICPRECNVLRHEKKGYCNSDNKIKIARAALHFWEEPCISGKKGSGTVFFCGCNLKCVYCQNIKISRGDLGKYITEDELCDIFFDLKKQGANNINLVTPTHYLNEIITAINKSKDKNIKIPFLYNTSGYEKKESIKKLDKKIDIYLPDFKYWDNTFAKKYSNCENYREFAISSIDEMVKQVGKPCFDEKGIMTKGVIVRHLVLPYLEEDSKKILEYLYKTYKDDIFISIMHQYTPPKNIDFEKFEKFEELKYPVRDYQYNEIVDYAEYLGIKNAFIQSGDAVGESFIPEFM